MEIVEHVLGDNARSYIKRFRNEETWGEWIAQPVDWSKLTGSVFLPEGCAPLVHERDLGYNFSDLMDWKKYWKERDSLTSDEELQEGEWNPMYMKLKDKYFSKPTSVAVFWCNPDRGATVPTLLPDKSVIYSVFGGKVATLTGGQLTGANFEYVLENRSSVGMIGFYDAELLFAEGKNKLVVDPKAFIYPAFDDIDYILYEV